MNTDSPDVEIDSADLAAELDDDPEPDLPDGDIDDDYELYEGPVHGGPWDERYAQSRFPKGFLLVDMPGKQVWIYDRADDGSFWARYEAPMNLDDAKRWKTADEDQYDLLVPDAEMTQS